jgi:hypothetical protein
MRPAHDDLRTLRALAHLCDVRLETLAVTVGLGRHLLGLRQEGLDLPEVEQGVPALLLLHDAGDDVALAARELLVGHLALRVAEPLEDHLLRGLRADPPLELVGDLDLLFGQDLGLDGDLALLVIVLDPFELLDPDAQVTALRVDLRPHAEGLLIELRVLLLPPRLVGGRHRFLEPLEDRLERDALLTLELAQRRDHLLVHLELPFSSAPPTIVRADATSSLRRSPTAIASFAVGRDQLALVRGRSRRSADPADCLADRPAKSSGVSVRSMPGRDPSERARLEPEIQPAWIRSDDPRRVEADLAVAVDDDVEDPWPAARAKLTSTSPSLAPPRPTPASPPPRPGHPSGTGGREPTSGHPRLP